MAKLTKKTVRASKSSGCGAHTLTGSVTSSLTWTESYTVYLNPYRVTSRVDAVAQAKATAQATDKAVTQINTAIAALKCPSDCGILYVNGQNIAYTKVEVSSTVVSAPPPNGVTTVTTYKYMAIWTVQYECSSHVKILITPAWLEKIRKQFGP